MPTYNDVLKYEQQLAARSGGEHVPHKGNWFTSLLNKITGVDMTGAQYAQNAFQQHMADTQYQRGVQDMQKAGLNPALMMGSGASPAPSPSGADVGSNGDFGSLIQAMMLPQQLKQMAASIANVNADSELKKTQASLNRSQAASIDQNLWFDQILFDARKQGMELGNKLTFEQTENARKQRKLINEQISLAIKQAATEDEKRLLTQAQTALHNAQAREILELLPFRQALSEAQSEQARMAAKLSSVSAAYQSGLIDRGELDKRIELYEQQIRREASSAELQEFNALIADFKQRIRNGEIYTVDEAAKWYELRKQSNNLKNRAMNKLVREVSIMGEALTGGLGPALGALK